MSDLRVVCVDAKNRPSDFPAQFWIEKDEMYTVLQIQKMAMQPGVFGVVLQEIDLPADIPYDSFISTRFRPATQDDMDAIEAVEKLLEEVEIGDLIYV